MRRFFGAVVASLVVLSSVSMTADATVSSLSGDVQAIAPPPSALPNTLEHATDVFEWDEQQGVTLASPVRTDIRTPGVYDDPGDTSPDTIPAGTVVDSHFFHSDRLGQGPATGTIERNFTVTFPTDILGIVTATGKLADSDILGVPPTIYGGADRGTTFGNASGSDILTLVDQRTIVAALRTTSGLDQFRVITLHDGPPTVNAGGPYAGFEGDPVALSATAVDPEGTALSVSWSETHTGDPGTVCSFAGAGTLDPSLTCNDDALVTATVSVSDGVNLPVTHTAQVAVGNAAPVSDPLVVPGAPVPLGDAASVSLGFTDPGSNDTHTATVTWGDTTSSTASVSEAAGAGTASVSHTYALPGLYSVSMTLEDDNGASVVETAQITVNGPPAADAGGPYTGSEGLPTALAGTAIDPEGDPLTVGWTFAPGALDAGASCTSTGDATLTPSLTCTDDAVVAAELAAADGINPATISATTVAVANEAPLLGALGVTAGPIATGSTVNVIAPFTDDGTNDTHVASVDWGDLTDSAGTISESAGAGSLSAGHAYATAGIYTITVTLTDDDLGTDQRTATVVVNSAPEVDAGGPYVGLEGAPLALGGTASDADGDLLTVSWSFSVAGGPGTVCLPTGAGSLTPTLTCTDDATVTATLTATDGVNAPVSSTATIQVGNTQPLVGVAVPSSETAPQGSTISVGLAFSDNGTNDTHTATIDWGDGTTEPGLVGGTAGSGTVSGAHVYGSSGTFTITVTVIDDDGDAATVTTGVVINGAPTAGAGGPYTGVEGSGVTLAGTAADPDADALLIGWTHTVLLADPGTVCTFTGTDTLTPTLTCDDDALVDVTITVGDGVYPTVVDSATVAIENAAPAVGSPLATPNPAPFGAPITLAAGFTDPGVNDDPSASIDWGDGNIDAASVVETAGSGTASGVHSYAAPGSYTAELTVNDKDNGATTVETVIVVNAPPVIDAAGPYSGEEGDPLALAGAATDDDGDPLALSWSFVTTIDPGGSCTMSGTATLVPSLTCNDDAVIAATLTADDGVNPPVSDTTTITIANVAPGVGLVTVPATPVPVGTSISALDDLRRPGFERHPHGHGRLG